MTHIGPLSGLPIACTLPAAGRAQVEKWRAFDEDYALETKRTDTRLTVHYAKVDDSIRRLRELVAVESTCCAFVDWSIDEGAGPSAAHGQRNTRTTHCAQHRLDLNSGGYGVRRLS